MLCHAAPRSTSNHIHVGCLGIDKARPLVGAPFPSLALLCCLQGCMETRLIFPAQIIYFLSDKASKEQDQDTVVIFWVHSFAAPYIECSSFHLSLYVSKYTHFSPSLLTDAHICLMSLNTRALLLLSQPGFPDSGTHCLLVSHRPWIMKPKSPTA